MAVLELDFKRFPSATAAPAPCGKLCRRTEMARQTPMFECRSCGYSSAKWLGRCPDCGTWNSFVEEKRARPAAGRPAPLDPGSPVIRLGEVSAAESPRFLTCDPEFDRVLGGGLVAGSLVLLGGEPGIGKSTLLLQVALQLQARGRRVLYVSGEESARQIKMRADRLGPEADDLYLMTEPNLERILEAVEEFQPTELVIDSIQTTYSEEMESPPGSVSQVRQVAHRLLTVAKSRNMPVFLIGHVTKDGSLAGPKALEHMVDTVVYFEGERHHNHRIIRAVKNRFGAANEIGIFEMTSRGLVPVRNPSQLFLRQTEAAAAPGCAVVCTLEGTRPMLIEVQALVTATQYGQGRRMATGLDYNRLVVLAAMTEKKLGIPLGGCDIYVNVAGGLEVREPAADLAVFAAVLSSFRNRPLAGK
ncbi:MAG: DNA repair protein RadA, partial [Acidobacteria bacterium]|nr:DNA repair protein RadA [Acidobacteriota bacterium]